LDERLVIQLVIWKDAWSEYLLEKSVSELESWSVELGFEMVAKRLLAKDESLGMNLEMVTSDVDPNIDIRSHHKQTCQRCSSKSNSLHHPSHTRLCCRKCRFQECQNHNTHLPSTEGSPRRIAGQWEWKMVNLKAERREVPKTEDSLGSS
jgi:hypothetical protein